MNDETSETVCYNFSPGPGVLFKDVLQQVQAELMDFRNTGSSILELNHRSPQFVALLLRTKNTLRLLAKIPDNFEILFLQGGATQVFSSIPLNFCGQDDTVDYIVNGYWSELAAKEANKFARVNIICSDYNYTSCPEQSELRISPNSRYVHYCSNETIHGVQFQSLPNVGNIPLICDMSSDFLSKPIRDIHRYGMIYAGSHKNVGPAGMVIVIVRQDLLNRRCRRGELPLMLNYAELGKHNSMLNTPPVFNIYFAGLTFIKLIHLGGLNEMKRANREKAMLLYRCIDDSEGFYTCWMEPKDRSVMNVPFMLPTERLEKEFIADAATHGLNGLRGHTVVGHCRASLYNAMSLEGVQKLVEFMVWFQNKIKIDSI